MLLLSKRRDIVNWYSYSHLISSSFIDLAWIIHKRTKEG
jgi:hypothetical protein